MQEACHPETSVAGADMAPHQLPIHGHKRQGCCAYHPIRQKGTLRPDMELITGTSLLGAPINCRLLERT